MWKDLRMFQRSIICISIIVLALFSSVSYCENNKKISPEFRGVVFTPFIDDSNYKGAWKLSEDIPNYLAVYLREYKQVEVLSSASFLSLLPENSRKYDVYSDLEFLNEIKFNQPDTLNNEYRYLIFGKIANFSIQRFNAGESSVGGFENYSCSIEINLKVLKIENENGFTKANVEFTDRIESSVNRSTLGLTLFGKPGEDKAQYYGLNNIKFGSEEFSKTIVGETMNALAENMWEIFNSNKAKLLESNLTKSATIKKNSDSSLDDIKLNTEIVKGELITFDQNTGEAFINLGSAQNLKVGEEFGIYTQTDSLFDPNTNEFLGVDEKKIAVLEVIEVRGEKFSLCVVKDSREFVKKGMKIKKIILTGK